MRAIGIVLAGGNSKRMRELSNKRAIAAMPIAGSYRSVDFALSNMSNSHIQSVAVLTQYNSRSLNEHLSSSKWWDFGRKQGGMYVFTPTITAESSDWYRGTADALYQNLDFLKKSHEPYVVIAGGDCVYKLDYGKVLEYHIEKKADITVVCKEMPPEEDVTRFGLVKLNDDGRITDSQGRTVDFKNTIIIMTSNLGSQYLLDGIDADGNISPEAEKEVMEDLQGHFRPEFLNRLDEIIMFKPLSKENIGGIIRLLMDDLNKRLSDREIKVALSPEAEHFVVEHGYDPVYGARPLKRYLQKNVETLAARLILAGNVGREDTILIDAKDGKLKADVKRVNSLERQEA